MVVCAALHFSSYYQTMPAVMASHFDAHGVANGWQTKDAFFTVLAGVTVLAAVLVFLVPAIVTSLPAQYVNLPNKEYWLAPERIDQSRQFMNQWFGWFGCAVYAVVCFAFDYAVKSNLPGAQPSAPAELLGVLGAFAIFSVVASLQFVKRFGRTP
jgi:uncharacterized membrane protein